MLRLIVSLFFTLALLTRMAVAQDAQVWVQVEAQPNLNTAQERIRAYSSELEDVNGFAMDGGWYAIALGPYSRVDAEQVLTVLRSERKIPRDSYIAFSRAYGQQFWPVGADSRAAVNVEPAQSSGAETDTAAADTAAADTTAGDTQQVAEATPVEPAPAEEPAPVEVVEPDETPAEARRSEAQLNRDERKNLQIMLQWAGYYTSAIDGAFGRGTRGAMSDWQADNGYETTGVLTTRQRAELERQYNSVLDGLDIQLVQDTTAGIEMKLPLGVVGFAKNEAPFAHYDATTDLGARVLLISQPGDQKTLFGLYDIMQTLEIVPLDGPRERRKDSFVLIGQNDQIISHTQAALQNGEIKGFTLIWPAGDEERRKRLLGIMQESYVRLDGVMSPNTGSDAAQSVDLVSGLQLRKPRLSRSGFFVDGRGTVVTTAEVVDGCTRITLEQGIEAELLGRDDALGLAAVKPAEALSPAEVAELQLSNPRLQSEVAVAGYSYGGMLGAPTLTFGKLADVSGLSGEEQLTRLALAALPGDTGGPVFDAGGAVVGMLLPRKEGDRQLPEDVSFALDAAPISSFLSGLGISTTSSQAMGVIAPEDLTDKAGAMTVLVSCWD